MNRREDSHKWITAYADAQAALERLAERRRLSPVRRAWRTRTLLVERMALARIDGMAVLESDFSVDGRGAVTPSPFDLTHWRNAVGAWIGLDALVQESGTLLGWLGLSADPDFGEVRDTADIRDRMAVWRRDIGILPPSPPLLHSARIAQAWHRHAPIGQGDLIAGLLIGDRWGPGRWGVSFGGLTALGLDSGTNPWKDVSEERFDMLWLNAIRTGAYIHLDLELRLRSYARRAAHQLAQRRRPGRLKDVLRMAMSHPRLTSRQVAKALGLTLAGAIKLLTIATGEGLLIEQSGQASYRSYGLPVAMGHRSIPHDALSEEYGPDFWEDGENEGSPEGC